MNARARTLLFAATALLATACARWPTKPTAPAWAEMATDPARPFTPGADRDGDGLSDDRERQLGSRPDTRDTDGDGFDDGVEDRLGPFGFRITQPDADRDRDGLTDARETSQGLDPANPDTDGDGWSDFDETLNAGYGYDPRQPSADADFDGLTDALEQRLESSPARVDSNGDGVSDFDAHSAGLPPNGPPLKGIPDELAGAAYSRAMADALAAMRTGKPFPAALAGELPYPIVTSALPTQGLRPSAALMQRAVANPHHSPGTYIPYIEYEQKLFALAQEYDGDPKPRIVRLFYWTGQTKDSCNMRDRNGHRIYAVKLSADPGANDPDKPEVGFFGLHHGRELISAATTLQLLETLTAGFGSDPTIGKLVDTHETWVIPVVNPNGYDRAAVDQISWRKNTRWEKDQTNCGIDLNRNYGFDHVASFPVAQRAALPDVGMTGVDSTTGALLMNSDTYPGPGPFSEVETQAVRGLAESVFASRKVEVDGLVCSLSWHAFSGLVMHPLSHAPIAPDIGVEPPDAAPFAALTASLAAATGYDDLRDDFPSTPNLDGCAINGYHSYGDASDWLYKTHRTRALTIEAYNQAERGGCPATLGALSAFSPDTAAGRDAVADNNVRAAVALLRECTGP